MGLRVRLPVPERRPLVPQPRQAHPSRQRQRHDQRLLLHARAIRRPKEAGEGPLLPILPAVCNAVYDAIGIRTNELPITPDKLYKQIERKMKVLDIKSPLDLPNPTLNHSELQKALDERANEHKIRDSERKLNTEREPYYNGTLFGIISSLSKDTLFMSL